MKKGQQVLYEGKECVTISRSNKAGYIFIKCDDHAVEYAKVKALTPFDNNQVPSQQNSKITHDEMLGYIDDINGVGYFKRMKDYVSQSKETEAKYEELKNDVKRYFELTNHGADENTIELILEFGMLHTKLSRVGNEE